MGGLQGWQIVMVLAVIVLLFGSRKLPDLARGLGSSLRIFKSETKGMMDEDKEPTGTAQAEQPRAVEPSAPAEPVHHNPVSESADQPKRDN